MKIAVPRFSLTLHATPVAVWLGKSDHRPDDAGADGREQDRERDAEDVGHAAAAREASI